LLIFSKTPGFRFSDVGEFVLVLAPLSIGKKG